MSDRPTIAKQISDIFDLAGRVRKVMEAPSKVSSEELVLACPDGRAQYTAVLHVDAGFRRKFGRKISLPYPSIQRVGLRSSHGFVTQEPAIRRTTDGYEIILDELSTDAEDFLLNVDYRLDGSNVVADLVSTTYASEARIDGDEDEYWVAAQLKAPDMLERNYRRIQLQDVDLGVDVSVQQDLSTGISARLRDELDLAQRLVRERDRNARAKLEKRHYGKMLRSGSTSALDIYQHLERLFRPPRFRSFVEVRDQFRLSDVMPGAQRITSPDTIPRQMRVIARTDLSLANPSANGKVRYKRVAFRNELLKLTDPQAVPVNASPSEPQKTASSPATK